MCHLPQDVTKAGGCCPPALSLTHEEKFRGLFVCSKLSHGPTKAQPQPEGNDSQSCQLQHKHSSQDCSDKGCRASQQCLGTLCFLKIPQLRTALSENSGSTCQCLITTNSYYSAIGTSFFQLFSAVVLLNLLETLKPLQLFNYQNWA